MPGAPNRPPEVAEAPPPVAPVPEPPDRKVLRRLVPSHVALLLEIWKGAPSPELIGPFEKAEADFAAGDFGNATQALDRLSIRFAEPRWPSLPEPFKLLRVAIPAPMPPHWDPDHQLAAPEKEARRARREAETQLALARGCVAFGASHGIDTADLGPRVEAAAAALGPTGLPADFYVVLDGVWSDLRPRLPRPKSPAGRAAPPRAPEPDAAASDT